MKKINPSLPKGTRDFSPTIMLKRDYLLNIIKNIFSLYGFNSIETPSIENLEVLNGKYGEEGDKLIFRILNSGNFLEGIDNDDIINSNSLRSKISKIGLRYDLTVPFARYVSMNRNKIILPFKRYQIQKVWRADRPQRGRFREFYQCDVDYIGTKSIICENEIINLVISIFNKVKIEDFIIKVNNRKILAGISEVFNFQDKFNQFCIIIDKIDKIGLNKINQELKKIKLTKDSINQINKILLLEGSNEQKLNYIKNILKSSKIGSEGVSEIESLMKLTSKFEFDLNLARGLSYYTSSIFEVVLENKDLGSLCGGGRYDDLTEIFGLKNISGVGISFGIERIFEIMEERNLFPNNLNQSNDVLVSYLSEKYISKSLEIANSLRKQNIKVDVYAENSKIKKQLQYANKNKIPFVIIIGEDEVKSKLFTLKNMKDGTQENLTINEIISKVSR